MEEYIKQEDKLHQVYVGKPSESKEQEGQVLDESKDNSPVKPKKVGYRANRKSKKSI